MATINYPLTKTVLSAEGSAEVIAYGTNTYTALWSDNTDTDWSLWDTFPTVVRFGNYVYCWHKTASSHTYYILIDVVEDPNSGNALGGNLAYPELTNPKLDTISNVYTGNSVSAVLEDGPYTPLAIGDKVVKGNTPAAGFETDRYIDFISPVFTNGTLTTAHISGANASAAAIHRIRGWGDHSVMAGTDGDNRYGLFAPFATKEQFESVYGKESDWVITPHSTQEQWLFDNSSNTSYTVAYANGAGLTYPFTVAAMIPNTLYRDVAGDTTGDGNDNTPSLEDALALYAITTAFVPALDPTKCAGFPGDLSIPGIPAIDINSIKEKLNDTKAGIEAAISSTGLLDLEKKLDGLRADILAKIPKPSQVLSLAADMAGIDPSDFDAIEALNEKWKGAVDNVSGFFDDLGGFDICSLIGLNGKVDADGVLQKKPEDPSVPESEMEAPGQSSYVPSQSSNSAQNAFQASVGMTPSKLDVLYKEHDGIWRTIRTDESYMWAEYIGKIEQGDSRFEKKFKDFIASPDYVKGRTAENKVKGSGVKLFSAARVAELRKELKEVYIPAYNFQTIKSQWCFSTKRLMDYELILGPKGEYFPTVDFDVAAMIKFENASVEQVGSSANNWLNVSPIDQANRDFLLRMGTDIVAAIKKHFFSEEGVRLQIMIMAGGGRIHDKAIQEKIRAALVDGSEGDPADDSVNDPEPATFKDLVSGDVKYTYSKDTIRNQTVTPALMNILKSSAGAKGYSIEIYSGGQDWKGVGDRRTGSIRHDGGAAADIRVYNEKGRRLSAASHNSKDIDALQSFVKLLMANGITSVGADRDYMNGNLHVDIATNSPATCWGASGTSYKRIYAPSWLASLF